MAKAIVLSRFSVLRVGKKNQGFSFLVIYRPGKRIDNVAVIINL